MTFHGRCREDTQWLPLSAELVAGTSCARCSTFWAAMMMEEQLRRCLQFSILE
jgi:bacterioferritin-associated ferredoxin